MNLHLSNWFRYAPAIYLVLMIAATGHLIEHVLQMFQLYVWHIHPWGLIGQIADREWLHIWYNLPSYLIILPIYLAIRKNVPDFYRVDKSIKALTLFLWIQGYHLLEHAVKIYQYVTTGIEPAPGMLGNIFPLVPLHFALVIVTYVLTMIVFARSPLIGYKAFGAGPQTFWMSP